MRRLLLMRHAKSSWNHPGLRDFDRPLSPRGENAAPRIGRYLQTQNLIPDLVFCSSAKRTRQTAALVFSQFSSSPSMLFEDSLYGATISNLLDLIHAAEDESVATIMTIGHNPETQGLALHLSRVAESTAMRALKAKFPTAGLAIIEFDTSSWSDVLADQGRLTDFITPRTLGNDQDPDR